MKTHEENLQAFLALGGDPKLANKHKLPTIQNRAKISYFLSQLNKVEQTEVAKINTEEKLEENVAEKKEKLEIVEPSKPHFLGFIAKYPTELHSTYKDCYNEWLDVCRYKIELNGVAINDVNAAYEVQWKMHQSITNFDRYKKALDHWNEHKRILPTESKTDYSTYTLFELDQAKRSLATLISRRKKTIAKKEKELPPVDAMDYRKKLAAIQLKKEQLEEMLLNEIKINEYLGKL